MNNLLFAFLFLVPLISFTQIIGKVVRVADGDTVTLLDSTNTQIRIRLYGIDCPDSCPFKIWMICISLNLLLFITLNYKTTLIIVAVLREDYKGIDHNCQSVARGQLVRCDR